MGGDKTEQPKVSEVAVTPAVMIFPSASTTAAAAFPQNAAKAAAKPLVEIPKHVAIAAVLKIAKPATKCLIHLDDHALHGIPVRTFRFAAESVLQLLEALAPGPVFLAPKLETQKREALHTRVHGPCLALVQRQAGCGHPRLNQRQSRIGGFARTTQHHKVIGISDHFKTGIGHQVVQWIKIDVTQQGTENSSLGRSGSRSPFVSTIHNAGMQEAPDQRQHAAIGDLRLQLCQQLVMRNRIKIRLEICIQYVHEARFQQVIHATQSVFAAATRAKSIAVLRKVTFEYWLYHVDYRRLDDAISHCRNSERASLIRAGFWDMDATYCLRSVPVRLQCIRQLPEILRDLLCEFVDADMVNAAGTVILCDLLERGKQVAFGKDFIKQTKLFASFHSVNQSRQHACGPDARFRCRPQWVNFSGSGLLSQRHCRRCGFRMSGHRAFHLPGTLRSTGITRFRHYYGSSDSCPSQSLGQVSLLYESNLPDVPTPTTPCRPRHHEFVFHVSVQPRIGAFRHRPIPRGIPYGTSASPLPSRLAATTGRIEFTFVSDHPFAFRCSPPRLTATQFRSATVSNSNLLTGTRTLLI